MRVTAIIIISLYIGQALVSCSSSEEGTEELETSEEDDEAAEQGVENEGEENLSKENTQGGQFEGEEMNQAAGLTNSNQQQVVEAQFEGGEEVNNAVANEFDKENIGLAPQDQGGVPAGSGNIALGADAPSENAALPPTDTTATNPAFATGLDALPSEPSAFAAPSGLAFAREQASVRYALGSANLFANQGSTAPVGSMQKGDHPLVLSEGSYGRTSDGFFIPQSELTAEPVPRDYAPAAWQQ